MTIQTIFPESQAPEGFNAVLKESGPKRNVTKYDLLPEGCYVARFKKINPQKPDEKHVAGTLTFEVDIPSLNKSVDVNIPYYDNDDYGRSLNTHVIIWFDWIATDEETKAINWNEHIGREACVMIDHYDYEDGRHEEFGAYHPNHMPLNP